MICKKNIYLSTFEYSNPYSFCADIKELSKTRGKVDTSFEKVNTITKINKKLINEMFGFGTLPYQGPKFKKSFKCLAGT